MPWMCGQLQVLRLDFKIGELVRHLAVNVTMPKDIRRATRKQYSAEEKIRIVLDGLRGEETIAECSLINFKAANQAARINQSLKETVFER